MHEGETILVTTSKTTPEIQSNVKHGHAETEYETKIIIIKNKTIKSLYMLYLKHDTG